MLLVSLAECNLGCVSPNYAKRYLVVEIFVQVAIGIKPELPCLGQLTPFIPQSFEGLPRTVLKAV
jgi:hypothetical protein